MSVRDRIRNMDSTTKFKIAGAVTIAAGAVVLHVARVRQLAEGFTLMYEAGVEDAYNDGVRYGISLAKETGLIQAATEVAS